MPQEDLRPHIQNEGADGQTGPHTVIWGSGGPAVPREVTKGKGRIPQEVEGEERQGDPQAQAVELPQGETEASQPEVSADARLPPEEIPA